jgi:hypothetical protein
MLLQRNSSTFKLGARKPDPAHLLRSIPLGKILKSTVVPAYPPIDDNFTDYGLKTWPMGLNDSMGTCVAVGAAHLRRLYIKALTGVDVEWTDAQILQFYATQNPNGADNGMDVQTALEYLHHTGGPDGVKLVAFASVDYNNYDEVRAAAHIFGGMLNGFLVQEHNFYEFDSGSPWTYDPSDRNVGGHCTLVGGYGATMNTAFDFITWTQECLFTDSFWKHQMGELWVAIWPELMQTARFADNIDLTALAAEYAAVTGGGVLPVPPVPDPSPNPAPTPPGCLPLANAAYQVYKWAGFK